MVDSGHPKIKSEQKEWKIIVWFNQTGESAEPLKSSSLFKKFKELWLDSLQLSRESSFQSLRSLVLGT